MPANLGYITALLFNQNNCAAEASTVTTKLEVDVGTDLSVLMGYDKDKCMGHLTAGGSVANIEAVWAARKCQVLSTRTTGGFAEGGQVCSC